MAILNQKNSSDHKTMSEYKAHPHSKGSNQFNFRMPDNIAEALQVLSEDSHISKTDLVNLAIYNLLCHKGYENKKHKKETKKIVV